ncbi:MAG: nuclear transport factor 2 family protein [Polaromonas sp.]|uniref:nuclear transport factor 2 family protein n=1 Tax=Polaromonas sp. TaxID=1869339 RepID=UPI00182A7A3C|nr:nuclear transport factor 2 family protein [Polaromonas sp.]MBA3594033.1 nuclear transport factor 2 family protein [Polaromonas sp.]
MADSKQSLVDLETKFWQSMVDQDADGAVALLSEPALMVSSHGAMQFDHAGYRKMADQGPMVVTGFDFEDMQVVFPNETTAVLTYRVKQQVAPRDKKGQGMSQEMNDSSTWIKVGDSWKCVLHTETPAGKKPGGH